MKTLTTHEGREMPAFGLGTWKSEAGEVYQAVRTALEVGYRHIDCAAIYLNEAEVGRAINDALKAGDIKREELWVTSKLWNDAHAVDAVQPALEKTLRDLQLDYLDLYLIHWPVAFGLGVTFPKNRSEFRTLDEVPLEGTWQAMVDCRERGLSREVGVSNMGPERIGLVSKAVGVTPAVNQVESHPHLQQKDLLAYCNAQGIILTAYSPLGSPDRTHRKADEPALLDHPVIAAIAEDLGGTPGQVLIQWAVQRGTVVIPKSANPKRIKQNLDALELTLSKEHMATIAAMDAGYRFIDGEFFAAEFSPYTANGIWV